MGRYERRLVLGLALVTSLAVGGRPTVAATSNDPLGFAANYRVDVQAWADSVGIGFDEALARANARQALDPALAQIAVAPDIFTGAYFTQDAKSYVFHIVAKEGVDAPIDLPESTVITVVRETAPRSKAELLSLRRQFESSVEWAGVGINVATGRLDATVPTEGAANTAMAAGYSDFADIHVGASPTFATCYDGYSCTPWRAGIEILSSPVIIPGTWECTWGFTAKSGSAWRFLTAAHCNEDGNGNGGFSWFHDGIWIGDTKDSSLHDIWDVQKVGGNVAAHIGSHANWIYYSNSFQNYPITSVEGNAYQAIGDPVNMTGISSGTAASKTIADNDYDYGIYYNGVFIGLGGVKVNYQMAKGDSGGPTYFNGAADGLLSAIGPGFTVYTYIQTDASQMNATICITASC